MVIDIDTVTAELYTITVGKTPAAQARSFRNAIIDQQIEGLTEEQISYNRTSQTLTVRNASAAVRDFTSNYIESQIRSAVPDITYTCDLVGAEKPKVIDVDTLRRKNAYLEDRLRRKTTECRRLQENIGSLQEVRSYVERIRELNEISVSDVPDYTRELQKIMLKLGRQMPLEEVRKIPRDKAAAMPSLFLLYAEKHPDIQQNYEKSVLEFAALNEKMKITDLEIVEQVGLTIENGKEVISAVRKKHRSEHERLQQVDDEFKQKQRMPWVSSLHETIINTLEQLDELEASKITFKKRAKLGPSTIPIYVEYGKVLGQDSASIHIPSDDIAPTTLLDKAITQAIGLEYRNIDPKSNLVQYLVQSADPKEYVRQKLVHAVSLIRQPDIGIKLITAEQVIVPRHTLQYPDEAPAIPDGVSKWQAAGYKANNVKTEKNRRVGLYRQFLDSSVGQQVALRDVVAYISETGLTAPSKGLVQSEITTLYPNRFRMDRPGARKAFTVYASEQ